MGRYGGEEFVMLLVGTDTNEARAVAEKIRQEISQLGFHFHDHPVAITASCGITSFMGDDTTGRRLRPGRQGPLPRQGIGPELLHRRLSAIAGPASGPRMPAFFLSCQ